MKKPDHRSLFQHPQLSKTLNNNGVSFDVDLHGFVSSADFENLGHIEDCEAFAEMIFDMIEILELE